METHVCVLQTVLGLLALGKQVFVVEDVCDSRTPASKAAGLARMRDAGAQIVTGEMVLNLPGGRALLNRVWLASAVLLLAVLQGCAGHREQAPSADPAQVRAELLRLLPTTLKDRQGWAEDIQVAFAAQRLEPSRSNLCAVLAVTEQESTFSADPQVPNLGRIAREEIDRRAARLHIPGLLVDGALNTRSANGQTYQQRLQAVRSEGQLSALFDDFLAGLPLGESLLGGFNPVRTGGPMQVSVDFAQRHAQDYPYAHEGSLRQEVFTRRGGLYFGIAHLLGYPAHYERPLYRFADYNAGWYASRTPPRHEAGAAQSADPQPVGAGKQPGAGRQRAVSRRVRPGRCPGR